MGDSETHDNQSSPGSKILAALRFIVIDAIITSVFAIIIQYGKGVFISAVNSTLGFLTSWWWALLGTLTVLLIGYSLYRFKKRSKKWYGLIEIAFALASAWSCVARLRRANEFASWLAVAAAAYLVQRGFSNYNESLSTQSVKT